MRFRKFEAMNLFSIGSAVLDLTGRGVVLVTGYSEDEQGENGSGKSSLTSKGIVWTLFGRTPRGSKGDSVINNKKTGFQDCFGRIGFTSQDGQTDYLVHRSRAPNKLLFYVNGKDLTRRQESETQELIDKALGLDYKTFLQTAFFGQGRKDGYAELTGAAQKEVLEQILPLESLEGWYAGAEDATKKVQRLADTLGLRLTTAEVTVRTSKAQFDQVQTKQQNWDAEQNSKIVAAQASLEKAQVDTGVKTMELVRLEHGLAALPQPEELSESLENCEEQLRDHRGKEKPILNKLDEAIRRQQEWDKHLALLAIQQREVKTECPICKQPLPAERIEQLQVEQNILSQQVQEAMKALENCNAVRVSWDEERSRWGVGFQSLDNRREEIMKTMEKRLKIQSSIAETESVLSHMPSPSGIAEYIRTLEAAVNPFTQLLNDNNDAYQTALGNETDARVQKAKIDEELEHLKWWKDAFKNSLRTFIFETICPWLEARTQHYLNELRNPQLHVAFSTIKTLKSGETKDDFNVTAVSDSGGEEFDLLSGGEQQITNFSIGLALAELAGAQVEGRPDLLICDEPFTNLDRRNAEAVTDFLKRYTTGTTLLVSNEESLKSLVPNRVHLVKRAGVSNVEDY